MILQVFSESDKDVVREKSALFSILFAVIGVVSFVTLFLQVTCLAHSHHSRNSLICLLSLYLNPEFNTHTHMQSHTLAHNSSEVVL